MTNLHQQVGFWNLFAIYSISIQNISLFSIAILCLLRGFLSKFSDFISGLISLLIIILVALIFCFSVIVYYWHEAINLADHKQQSLFIQVLFTSSLIGAVALRYFYLQAQYRQQLSSQASAKLKALQARIRPHFLFNSMNIIASLTRIDAEKAEAAIQDLSDLFRVILDNKQTLISFAEELDNSERYLSIEKLRLGERLQIDKQVDAACLEVLIPPLSLQPLLENAVYHGVQMLPQGGRLSISAIIENDLLVITVINPKAEEKHRFGHGMALRNITQRLEFIYQGKASLNRQADDINYTVTMKIPIKISNTN